MDCVFLMCVCAVVSITRVHGAGVKLDLEMLEVGAGLDMAGG